MYIFLLIVRLTFLHCFEISKKNKIWMSNSIKNKKILDMHIQFPLSNRICECKLLKDCFYANKAKTFVYVLQYFI